MDLQCDVSLATGYTSRAQIARVVTELWAGRNLYCPACPTDSLSPASTNTRVYDFLCKNCSEPYQLKSMARWNNTRVVDSAYSTMIAAIRQDSTPNLLLLHYSPSWWVERLILIPRFFLHESIIEKRPPLAAGARRAGWVGCNVRIDGMPPEGKIAVVAERRCISPARVRSAYAKCRGLAAIPPTLRGWTLDVLQCVKQLKAETFSLSDVYRFEDALSALHPENQHVRPKIRQQLQVLRDLGFIEFLGAGQYAVR